MLCKFGKFIGVSAGEQEEVEVLTREYCGKIAHLYNLSLKSNKGDSSSALRDINAIPNHLGANDHNAATNHEHCPKDSWC